MISRRVRAMPQVGAFMLLFLAGAGCFHKDTLPSPPAPSSANKANLEGIVEVVPVEIHKKESGTHGGSCAVDLVYPTLYNSPYVDATNDLATEVYTFLHHQLETEDVPTSDDAVTQAVDQYISSCLARLEADTTSATAEDNAVDSYLDQYAAADFTVTLNAFHLLSISLEGSGYSGGAHGETTEKFVNVDLGGNRLMTLGDILVDDQLKAFFQHEKQKLLDTQSDVLYPASVEEFKTFIADSTSMDTAEQQNVYGKFDNFYLTPSSIVTVYNSYEIAPYAAGPIKVEMSLQELGDFIDHSKPFYPLVEDAASQQ